MDKDSRVYVAGHGGLVGSAIVRELNAKGYKNIITQSRNDLELTNASCVREFFINEKPEYVFLAAARVGGILANNNFPVEFLTDNLLIQNNILKNAYDSGTKKLLFLGSSCVYPKYAKQPLKEEYLLSGHLEATNEAYAIAKIAGIKLGQAYQKQYGFNVINLMPTNLYGPNDNYDLESSHVLPALIRKFHEAKIHNIKTVSIWGDGSPLREFLHVDDLADASLFLMQNYNSSKVINVGTGKEISILNLAYLTKELIGYKGEIIIDSTKPNGTPRKLLDVSKINDLGWESKISLSNGIKETYEWFLKTYE